MRSVPEAVRRLAEDPEAFAPLEPGDERIEDPRYVIRFSQGRFPWSVGVQRLRLAEPDVEPAVAEIRALIAERGRDVSTWKVGSSATPPDLGERLLAVGMTGEGGYVGMVLAAPPEPRPATGFVVRLAETWEEYQAGTEVLIESFSFEFEPQEADEARAQARRRFEEQQSGGPTALAVVWEGGQPIATGRVTFTEWGLYLGGGGTLPSARGRGAFSALLPAAWKEAVRRGTPALITQAQPTSRPILRKLGFEEVASIRQLRDRLGR